MNNIKTQIKYLYNLVYNCIMKLQHVNNTVAYLFKVRAADPEKQLLLAKSSETTFISGQWKRNRQQNNVHC